MEAPDLDLPKPVRQVILPVALVMAAIVALTLAADAALGLDNVTVFGPVLRMSMALGAGIIAVAGLRWLDRIQGRNTVEWINEMGDTARALYLGLRLVALGLLLGLPLS